MCIFSLSMRAAFVVLNTYFGRKTEGVRLKVTDMPAGATAFTQH